MARVDAADPERLGEGLSPKGRPNERVRGILCVVGGAMAFTLQDMIIKLVSGEYPLAEALTIRCLVAFLPILFLIHLDGGLGRLAIRWSPAVMLRGLLLLLSYTCYYLSIAAMPLATAVALFFSSPLFIVGLAGPVLGERVGAVRWLTILAGFGGVLIVSRPDSAAIDPRALLSLGAAVFYALAQLMTRRLGPGERASIMTLIQNVVYLAAALAMGAIAGRGGLASSSDASLQFLLRAWVSPAPLDLALMAATGLIAAGASWLLTQGYRIAPVNDVAPFEYSTVPWATLCGLLLWGEVPRPSTLIGILIIIGAGVYLLRRPRRRP
jgi:drug/metabolite transporter (DMT)-like permease